MPIALSALIERVADDRDLLDQILSSFSCKQDDDIQKFLHTRAVKFEELSKSRTYLICDEDQLNSEDFCLDQLIIYGYISLALKVLSVPETVDNKTRKELDGLSSKIHGERINDFSCYLIGQLSRNSNVPKDSVSGSELLQFAYDIISDAVTAVGGRYMMIECHDRKELIQFYLNNHFSEISRIPDQELPMVQMIRKI